MNLTWIRIEILYRELSELFNCVVCALAITISLHGSTFLLLYFYSALKLIFWSKMVKIRQSTIVMACLFQKYPAVFDHVIEYYALAVDFILRGHRFTFTLMMKSRT